MNYQEHRLLLLKLVDEALRYKFEISKTQTDELRSKGIKIKGRSH